MLRISIVVTAFLALGCVRAKIYKNVESIDYIVESNKNPYFAIRTESSDEGPIYWLDILQDITPKLKLQLCEKWEYDTRGYGGDTCGSGGGGGNGTPVPPHNGTIHGPICRELCCVLDDLSDVKPEYPGLDMMLGLRSQLCPLKKGSSYNIPRFTMPETLDVDFQMERDYIDYEAYILPRGHCSPKDVPSWYIRTTLVFFPCNTGH